MRSFSRAPRDILSSLSFASVRLNKLTPSIFSRRRMPTSSWSSPTPLCATARPAHSQTSAIVDVFVTAGAIAAKPRRANTDSANRTGGASSRLIILRKIRVSLCEWSCIRSVDGRGEKDRRPRRAESRARSSQPGDCCLKLYLYTVPIEIRYWAKACVDTVERQAFVHRLLELGVSLLKIIATFTCANRATKMRSGVVVLLLATAAAINVARE